MDDATTTTAPAKRKLRSEWRENVRFALTFLLLAVLFRSFFFSAFNIPSQSMLPRLLIGDYLIVSKWSYGYSRYSLPFSLPLIPGRIFARDPERGDTVVFRGPAPDNHDVIKRVIGLPGDTIQMRSGQLILNAVAVPKERVADFVVPLTANYPTSECPAPFQNTDAVGAPICQYAQFRETLPNGKRYLVLDRGAFPQADDTPLFTVPAGHVFVMGDNRDDSGDSRFAPPEGMGFVPIEKIQGKAQLMFFSTDGNVSLAPWTWFTATRWNRIGGGF
ncbi:MAG: signal peptidase I [Sphingomonas sp.]